MNNISVEDRNVLMTFLKVLRNNQEFYMRQEWATTNYTLILYGLIIVSLINSNWIIISSWGKVFTTIVSTALLLFGILTINSLEESIRECRTMAGRIYERITILNDILEGDHRAAYLSWVFRIIIAAGWVYIIMVLFLK
jgi:hypothetical protein